MPVELSLAAGLVKEIWICVQNVKVHKWRCRNLAWRCDFLINVLTENTTEIEVPLPTDAIHETEVMLLGVRSKVTRWANLNIVQSILAQRDINEGVNDLHQKIDTCIAAYHVRIGQELVRGQRVLAIAAERDHNALQETLRDIQEKISRNMLETRAHTPFSRRPNTTPEEILHVIEGDINDIQPSTFDDDEFDSAVRRLCTSMETLDLSLTIDTVSGNPLSPCPLSSQVSIVTHNRPRNFMRSMSSVSLRLPEFSKGKWLSSMSLGSCPQIPPLDFDDEIIEYLPSHPLFTEPTCTPSSSSSVFSGKSSTRSRHRNVLTRSRDSVHTIGASISIGSATLSPLEIALSTRTSMLCSRGSPRVIIKGTMEGLVRYFLLNPADTEHCETFFAGHPVLISSQDVLRILIRHFDEASTYADDLRDVNVMRLIKTWLKTRDVIVTNDVLAEMQIFADSVDGSNDLRELALEVLQLIPDKAVQNFPYSPTMSSLGSRSDPKPTPSQLAVALATLERKRYLRILAAEYISHACKLTSYCPNLLEALAFNTKIANWVMSSILQCDDLNGRADIKMFFVDVAQECRQIRNFSSMCAIVGALQTNAISCLRLTHNAMSHKVQRRYQKLTSLLKRESNYSAYRTAVQLDDESACIPWHEVHLHDVKTVLQEERDVEDHHEAPLINFEKWTHLKEKVMDAMRYRDIPLQYDKDGLETAVAYLQRQLQPVSIDDGFSTRLETMSTALRQDEESMRRPAAMRSVGFN